MTRRLPDSAELIYVTEYFVGRGRGRWKLGVGEDGSLIVSIPVEPKENEATATLLPNQAIPVLKFLLKQLRNPPQRPAGPTGQDLRHRRGSRRNGAKAAVRQTFPHKSPKAALLEHIAARLKA